MNNNVDELYKLSLEIHDDGSKELDAGLRPLDHYRQVLNSLLWKASTPATILSSFIF
jgi:hypothetical protein